MHAFVIARDRVTYTARCVTALHRAGLSVVIVDHGSTWPPMVDWLDHMEHHEDPRYSVWRDVNRHPRDLWRPGGPINALVEVGERYIVTDCDVVPDEGCPTDWRQIMAAYLNYFPHVRKVGLGLRTDDLPEHFEHRAAVREWEARFQYPGAAPVIYNPGARAVWADVDTTFAMYQGYDPAKPFRLGPTLRLGAPYVARHLPWYENSGSLTPEQRYYREHAVHGHWRSGDPLGFTDDHGIGGGQ